MKNESEKNVPSEKKSTQKKCYQSPTLSSFGTVTQLTKAFENMMKLDGGSGMFTMVS